MAVGGIVVTVMKRQMNIQEPVRTRIEDGFLSNGVVRVFHLSLFLS